MSSLQIPFVLGASSVHSDFSQNSTNPSTTDCIPFGTSAKLSCMKFNTNPFNMSICHFDKSLSRGKYFSVSQLGFTNLLAVSFM